MVVVGRGDEGAEPDPGRDGRRRSESRDGPEPRRLGSPAHVMWSKVHRGRTPSPRPRATSPRPPTKGAPGGSPDRIALLDRTTWQAPAVHAGCQRRCGSLTVRRRGLDHVTVVDYRKLNFTAPDRTVEVPLTRLDIVELADFTIARRRPPAGMAVVPPREATRGGRLVPRPPHRGGRFRARRIVFSDGTSVEVNAGDAMDLPPFHDAWVIGEEPLVQIEFTGTNTFLGSAGSRGSRPSSSPTSSTRRWSRLVSATSSGASCSLTITAPTAPSSTGSAGPR